MKQRFVMLTIDTISELLKDYIANEEDLPSDAQPVRLLMKDGKLAIEFMSDHIKAGSPALGVNFQLRRLYGT